MHRCFLTGRSLYVVVLRQRSESRHNDLTLQARYWLENIHSFAPDCPVILAINREQGVSGSGGINSRQLREQFSIIVGEPIVYCAKEDTDDNFAVLTKAILDQALLLDSTEMEFPRSWNQVRSELEGMSNRKDLQGNKPYIDKSTYQKLCADHGIDDENIRRWLLEWFNDLGVCFSYHQEDGKELDRYQVLNPEWLTNAIYAVIMIGKRPEFSDNGIITCTEINTILQDPTKYAKERTAQFPISYEEDEQKMKTGKHIEFSIGVSFAGEQRDFIRQVFISLCDKGGFSKEELFFDEWHEHLINGANADYKLDKIYAEHCKKIVVLFSEAYIEKQWTNKLEWTRAITTRITADPENVCLLRHGPVDIDSIDLLHGRKDIVKDVSSMTPDAVADFILRWSERPEL